MNPTPEKVHWQIVESLFHEALELPESERERHCRQTCRGDDHLLNDVLSLIRAYRESGEFLEEWSAEEELLLSEVVADWTDTQTGEDDADAAGRPTDSVDRSSTDYLVATSFSPTREAASAGMLDLGEIQRAMKHSRPEYQVLGEVGRGGVGVVIRVRDQRLQRDLAVKLLQRDRGPERREVDVRRLEREGRATAAVVSDHIVRVHEFVELGEQQFPGLILEWIEGPSLLQLLNVYHIFAPREAAIITCQLARGLGAAHRAGIVHGDVKPANILLSPESPAEPPSRTEAAGRWQQDFRADQWRVKVTDFGLAQFSLREQEAPVDTLSPAFRFAGTPAFAGPERLLGGQSGTPQSDVWAAGATLYRMLTGSTPYRGAPHAIAKQMQSNDPTPPRRIDPMIPRDLESICLKALARSPQQRYANGAELAADLERFLTGHPIVARPIAWWQRWGRWALRNPRVAFLSVALILAVASLVAGSTLTATLIARKNSRILEHLRETEFARLQRIVEASPSVVPLAFESDALASDFAQEFLQHVFEDADRNQQTRINAAVLLAELGNVQPSFLIESVTRAPLHPSQCQNLVRGLGHQRETALGLLRNAISEAESPPDRARIAIVAGALGDLKLLATLGGETRDPSTRTEVIHILRRFHPEMEALQRWLLHDDLPDIQYMVSCGLAMWDLSEVADADRGKIADTLARVHAESRDAGVIAAARTALAAWDPSRGLDPSDRIDGAGVVAWEPGLQMVRIPAGTNTLGRAASDQLFDDNPPHVVQLTSDFWLADRETSSELFQLFLDDPEYPEEGKPNPDQRVAPEDWASPTPRHPRQRVSWFDAARFCNWLSWRHGKQPRYEFVSGRESASPESGTGLGVRIHRNADGFCLPTEAQWEYACRAGSQTEYFFGNDFERLIHYGTFTNARRAPTAPCGSLLPNRFGLHETLGNVWEWCEDWRMPLGTEPLIDPTGPDEPLPESVGRVFCGGGVSTMSGEPVAGARGFADPNSRFSNLGFRVALPTQNDGSATPAQ